MKIELYTNKGEKTMDWDEAKVFSPSASHKEKKVQTLEEQKTELEEDLKQSRQQEDVRKEMDKIRAEGWKEESTTDTHKIIYEAEKRVANKEYNSGNVDFLKEGKYIMCSKCLDNTPHIPAWGICQRCGTQYTTSLKV